MPEPTANNDHARNHVLPPPSHALEQPLQESSAILQSFYDSAPMMMGVVEVLENDILHLSDNAATIQFMGLTPGTTQRKRASEIGMPQQSIEKWLQHYRECARIQVPVRFHYAHQTPQEVRWLSVTVSFIAATTEGRFRCSYIAEDVTEQKHAISLMRQQSQALSNSERQLRTLIDHFPNGAVVLFDQDLRFTVGGGQGLAEAGMPPHFLEGKTVWEAFDPAVAAINAPLMRAALIGNASLTEVTYADRIYELNVLPVRNKEGDVVAGMTLTQDISARKAKETQQRFLKKATDLLASSLDYQTTLQSVAQLVVPHLADWCVVHLLNETGALELVTVAHVDPAKVEVARESSRRYPPRMDEPGGIAAVARTGKSQWLEDIPEEAIRAAAQDEEHYRMLSTSGMKSFLCVPLAARGKPLGTITFIGGESGHRYNAASLPLAEELARYVAIAVDNARLYAAAQKEIEERQRAEAALQVSRDYYRTLTEAVPQLVWTTGPDGVADYFNQQWYAYTGQVPGEAGGRGRGGVHPDDLSHTMKRWNVAVQTGEAYEIEYRLKRFDGAYRWFLVRGVPLKNAQGEILKWFGTCTDIDEQKRSEERARLLGELGERMRATNDPQAVLWAAVNIVGEHLQTSRCYYADTKVDSDQVMIHRDYCRDVKSWAGIYNLSAFGAEVIAELSRGKTMVITDTMTDPRTAAYFETTYLPAQIRAYVVVPLMEDGKWVAALGVNNSDAPRTWTAKEITLLETIAERTRMAVENARLWQAERERSEQLSVAIAEVHHRVKNSLQGVSALLEMQLPLNSETMPVQTVREGLNQIKTIALVHDLLARDQPIGNVDAAQVLTKLVELLSVGIRTAERLTPIRVQAEPLWIPTKAATALALAVNELISNAVKHNRNIDREDLQGHDAIELRLTKHMGEVRVLVQDSGPGFPANFNPKLHANIGLELVLTLVQHDLHGSVFFSNRADQAENASASGGRVEIIFPEHVVSE